MHIYKYMCVFTQYLFQYRSLCSNLLHFSGINIYIGIVYREHSDTYIYIYICVCVYRDSISIPSFLHIRVYV